MTHKLLLVLIYTVALVAFVAVTSIVEEKFKENRLVKYGSRLLAAVAILLLFYQPTESITDWLGVEPDNDGFKFAYMCFVFLVTGLVGHYGKTLRQRAAESVLMLFTVIAMGTIIATLMLMFGAWSTMSVMAWICNIIILLMAVATISYSIITMRMRKTL